jgi:predicted kinase
MDMDDVRRPEVVLLCGLAGSGKTTYAKHLETQGYMRLSVDEEIWRRFGRYGVDYQPDEYGQHTEVAREAVRARLLALLAEGRDVVVDSSFWQRSRRQEYKRLIEQAGGRWRLVYLRADPALLRARLDRRAARSDANAAFPITEELLARYLDSFEPPSGEGEEVVEARFGSVADVVGAGLDEGAFVGEDDDLGTVAEAELGQDAGDV